MKRLLSPRVQWILIVILLVFAVRSGLAVVNLWRAGKVIDEAERELDIAKIKQQTLEQKLLEVQSPEFVEREARNKLGYAREGETILVLPKETEVTKLQSDKVTEKIPNWQIWWELWLGL